MNRNVHWLVAGLTVAAGGWLLAGSAGAGGDKSPWQPILSKEVYDELATREADTIKTALEGTPDEAAINRAKLGAVFIAALTQSVKDKDSANEVRGVRDRAILLAQALAQKETVEAKKLLVDLFKQKPDSGKKPDLVWDKLLTTGELMDHFRPKAKGGDGIHPDLQSNIKLKGALNGIEEKIRNLSMKEMNAAGIKKESHELQLLAYRTAVAGALTYNYAPATKTGKKDPEEWRELSLKMRDSGVELANAVQKGDTTAVRNAGNNLNSACSQCHVVFR
jgi:hypothetical protein